MVKLYTRRNVLKKPFRIMLFLAILFLFCFSIIMAHTCINRDIDEQVLIYSYNINENAGYSVNLYDNSFVDTYVMQENESYVQTLVKSIDVDFGFNYNASKIIDVDYTYSVKAYLNGDYIIDNKSENVLKKEYVLIDEVNKKLTDSNSLNLLETVNIDYNYYNDVASDFRVQYKLPITATLDIIFSINVSGEIDDKTVDEKKTMTVSIPLNQQAFKITKEVEDPVKKNIYNHEKEEIFNKKRCIFSILLFIMSIVLFLLTYKEIFVIQKKTNYNIKLNKIFKEYGDIIVEIVSPIEHEGYSIVEVKNFNEMLDLERELRSPINFYEITPDFNGEFCLINNDILYIYMLDNEDKKI